MNVSRPDIVPRKVEINFEPTPPGTCLPSEGLLGRLLDLYSCVFPPGERFFIESVQNFEKMIRTPLLREQAHLFVYQEAMHAKVHQKWNETLWRSLPKGERLQSAAIGILAFYKRWTTRRFHLAITCAIEHFTAILADTALRNPSVIFGSCRPAVGRMWLWHAAEETEHKAVCFDVYREVVGTGLWPYLARISAMAAFSLYFIFGTFVALLWIGRCGTPQTQPSTSDQRSPRGEREKRGLFRLLWEIVPWRLYFAYYKPTFHPWDHDNADLVEAWKRRAAADEAEAVAEGSDRPNPAGAHAVEPQT